MDLNDFKIVQIVDIYIAIVVRRLKTSPVNGDIICYFLMPTRAFKIAKSSVKAANSKSLNCYQKSVWADAPKVNTSVDLTMTKRLARTFNITNNNHKHKNKNKNKKKKSFTHSFSRLNEYCSKLKFHLHFLKLFFYSAFL